MKRTLKITGFASIILIIFILLINSVNAYTPTHYVNVSHPSCNDAYTRVQASFANTPYCGLSSTMLTQAQSGDILQVACGTYYKNSAWSATSYTGKVILTSQTPGCAIFSNWVPIFKSANTCWTNVANITNYQIWNMTGGASCFNSTQTLLVFNSTDGSPFYPYRFASNITDTTVASRMEGCYSANSTIFSCKINASNPINPNNGGLGINQNATSTFSLSNDDFLHLDGLRIESSYYAIEITSASDNIVISNNTILGCSTDTGCIRASIGSMSNGMITQNNITRRFPIYWDWYAMKFGIHTETGAIWTERWGTNNSIIDNDINGYANGIVISNYNAPTPCSSNGTRVLRNRINWMMDDALEIEDYACNYNISYNNVSRIYTTFSFSQADSTSQRSYFGYNLALNNLNMPGIGSGPTFKWYDNPGPNNWQIEHITSCDASNAGGTAVMGGNGNLNMVANTNITNSLFGCDAIGTGPRLLDGTGDSADNVTYINVNFYKNGTNYARRINGSSDGTEYNYANMTSLGGGLFLNPTNYNPQLDAYGAPSNASNPICTGSTTGGFLGAVPGACATSSSGEPIINSFTSDAATIINGTGTTLRWSLSNTDNASINQGIGSVNPVSGSQAISPQATTTYTLTATNANATVNANVTVTVTNPVILDTSGRLAIRNNGKIMIYRGKITIW